MVFVVVGGILVLVVVVVATRRALAGARRAPGRGSAVPRPFVDTEVTITLDVSAGDPDAPSVTRLVDAAASQVLATSPRVETVTVVNRAGTVLGVRERPHDRPQPAREEPVLREPHRRTFRAPGPQAEPRPPAMPTLALEGDDAPGSRTLVERYDLPAAVASRIARPDDAVDLVRAILEAAGLDVRVDGEVLRVGREAIVVPTVDGRTVTADMLTRAYLDFQRSGATRGVVICLGHVSAGECRRRELLAPELRHTGAAAIQRMADAVALGGNPLLFVLEPSVG